jgi:hypothetical protein
VALHASIYLILSPKFFPIHLTFSARFTPSDMGVWDFFWVQNVRLASLRSFPRPSQTDADFAVPLHGQICLVLSSFFFPIHLTFSAAVIPAFLPRPRQFSWLGFCPREKGAPRERRHFPPP